MFRCLVSQRFLAVVFPAAALVGCSAATAYGQVAAPPAGAAKTLSAPVLRADSSELGIQIPQGEPKPAGGRRVLVNSDDDQSVVANVLVEVGDRFVVIMPDGRLQAVPSAGATVTDRPFVPATVKEVTNNLAYKYPGLTIKSTKHFVYCYNTSPLFYQGTSQILESLYPGLMNLLKSRKFEVADSPYPLVVVMFRTREEWARYMHGAVADSVTAIYDGVSNRVLMYEQSDLGEAVPEFAQKMLISTVAHEGVQQILHNIGVRRRLSQWPKWISEGLPEYLAPTSTGKTNRWKGAGQVNDLRMLSIDRMLKANVAEFSAVDRILLNDELDADGYAWAWALSHYLGEKKKEPFFKYLAEVAKLGPLEKMDPSKQEQLFATHFGTDRNKLSSEMVAHLRKLPYVDPIENLTHYVILYRYIRSGTLYTGHAVTASKTAVDKTREDLRARLPPDVQQTAQFEVRPFPTRTQALQFAQSLR